MDRKTPDSLQVGIVYRKSDSSGSGVFIKDVGVSEINGEFQLTYPTTPVFDYESRITANTFYERTSMAGGFLIIPPGYVIKDPGSPASEGIVISAKK